MKVYIDFSVQELNDLVDACSYVTSKFPNDSERTSKLRTKLWERLFHLEKEILAADKSEAERGK